MQKNIFSKFLLLVYAGKKDAKTVGDFCTEDQL